MSLADVRREHFIAWMESEGLNPKKVAEIADVPYTTLHSYVKSADTATKSLKGDNEAKIARAFNLPVEAIFGGDMVEPTKNHVAAWRRHKGIGLDELARRLGVPVPVLEQLEAGESPFGPKWQARIGGELGIPPGWLFLDPDEIPPVVLETFGPNANEAGKRRAVNILRELLTGTDG